MRVVIFSNIPSPYFVEYLNELGKKVDLVAYFERATASDRDSSWKKIDAREFECHILNGIPIGAETAFSLKIYSILKNNKGSLFIFANPTTLTGIIGTTICKLFKIPYVLQSEGGLAKDGVGFKEKIKKIILSGASLYLSGMGQNNDYFIAYGAPLELVKQYCFASFHDLDIPTEIISRDEKEKIKKQLMIPYKKVILYVGRMLHVKGVDVLLKAFYGFGNEVGLYLVGGEITNEYREIINENHINNCHFIPHLQLEELKKYYRLADVFVLPTRSDTWGLVINEAMTYGLPIVTTKSCVAGLELIDDSVNGYLVNSEDYEAMNNRIAKLLADDNACKEIGIRNFEKIHNYTFENMASQIYEHLENYWEGLCCQK